MPILTKAQLEALNQASFPDQSTEAITPAILRTYNTSTIDTLVDSLDTGSFATSAITGSSLVTASFNNSTRDLTFTKGNATQFSVNIPDVSGSTLPSGVVSGSAQITALGFVSSSVTGSSMVTGSISGNTITFTKGDSSTFNIVIPAASGSVFNTGSFATTGSNVFVGDQTIQSDGDKNGIFFISGSQFFVGQDQVGRFVISSSNQSRWMELNNDNGYAEIYAQNTNFNNTVSLRGRTEARGIFQQSGYPVQIDGTLSASLQAGYAFVGGADGYSKQVPTSSFAGAVPVGTATTGSNAFFGNQSISGSLVVSGSEIITGTLTASLQEGYAWVGGVGNVSKLVATSSFGGGSTINTGSFATTGSNTFTGNQTINGSISALNGIAAMVNQGNDVQQPIFVNNLGGVQPYPGFSIKIDSEKNPGNIYSYMAIDDLASGSGASDNNGGFSVQSFSPYGTGLATSLYGGGIGNGADNTIIASYAGKNYITKDTTITGSVKITSTLTASLQSGYVWAGGAGNVSTLVATSSFGGGGSIATGSFATTGSNFFAGVQAINYTQTVSSGEVYLLGDSGSLVIGNSTATPTYAALAHLSSSQTNGNTNLIFKSNSSTGDTIISGSGNIFTNPTTPTTGYTRYIGGSNNLYLNSTNGINSQITQSAASVSGLRPTMNNNIFNGTGNFSINQAPNTGTHTYSQNIITGTSSTTINALGFTGSLGFSGNFNNNGTITINAASASVAQIATGISGSGTVDVNYNYIANGSLIHTSPRLAGFSGQSSNNNIIAGGTLFINNISSSAAVNATGNITNGAITYTNASATAIHTANGSINSSQGAFTVNAIGSAVGIANSLSLGGITINNNAFTGSAGVGLTSANRNLYQGQGHTLTVTGSTQAGAASANFSDNAILGRSITVFSNQTDSGVYNSLNGIVIGGQNLIVSASNSFSLTEGGGAHFGRYNVNDGRRNKTGEIVFSVGTGTSIERKTGFLIDSGSNTFVEGTLSVNGNTAFTGSVKIIGATTISGSLIQSGAVSIQGETTFVNKNGNNTNIILGQFAMSDITGSIEKSVAIGQGAMRYASGSSLDSIAIGFNTLPVTTGVNNFALGSQALAENTSGGQNTAIGTGALNKNTIGIKNTAIGDGAGFANVSGSNNTYIGPSAGNNIFGGNNLLLGGYQGVGEIVNNNIILSTGGGSIKAQYNETAWLMKAPVNFTTGSNQQAGTAVLDGANPGTVTVSNSLVTANSIIMLTKQTLTNAHMVAVSSKGAGTFTITSNGNGDTDTVGWFIINNS